MYVMSMSMFMFACLTMLKLTTLNVQGMNNPQKRNFIFQLFLNERFDIICLQETHCPATSIDQWSAEWPGESFWNKGTSHSCGVAILFRPGLVASISNIDMDFNGRYLSLQVKIEEN